MKTPLRYIDRVTGKEEIEKVYGARALELLYGDDWVSRIFGAPLLYLTARFSLVSRLYGFWQHTRWSARKIRPFIKAYDVEVSEFLEPVSSFKSFNDFFIRHLKPSARPITQGDNIAVIPADGRYRFYPDVSRAFEFSVKGELFSLDKLLEDAALAARYEKGTLVMGRLCPSDYHRYHFPCDGVPGPSRIINGCLYSVNPIALKRDIQILMRNKRAICEIETESFGRVLFLEIGATNVGSIQQTYTPNSAISKGAEKGYFEFGASAVILLFEPGRIKIDPDLLAMSSQLEVRCLMGQRMGIGTVK